MCKAVIQEGPRKGETCNFLPEPDEYCGRHKRNKIYDEGIQEGKKWCKYFFRGCDNENDDKFLACKSCRESKSKKKAACEHEGCKFKVISGKFCKKHERDIYYLEEKEKNIKYCDIARGCFNILDKKKKCDTCLEKTRNTETKRNKKYKEIAIASQKNESNNRVCTTCQRNFEAYTNNNMIEALNCKTCCEKQAVQDSKRKNRIRNYKKEHFKNINSYYKTYIKESVKRGYGDFNIDFEQITKLVSSPCYYCNYINESETNGIDRVNNDIGYTPKNCVSACWECNRMKHFYHPLFFIEKCKIIAGKQTEKDFFNKWSSYYTRTCYINYAAYKINAEERELSFEITETQWDWLTRSKCYLCGYQSSKGIGLDRLDNSLRSYTFENCRPCCGSCNSMKNEITYSKLIEKAISIANKWEDTSTFINIPMTSNPLKDAEKKGHIIEPSKRNHWKASGLYYEFLSDTTDHFLKSYSLVYTKKELDAMSVIIKESTKENALKILKVLINTLKKRKIRNKSSQLE